MAEVLALVTRPAEALPPVTLRPCPALWSATVPGGAASAPLRALVRVLDAPPPAPGVCREVEGGLLWRAAPRTWRWLGAIAGATAPAALTALEGAACTDLGPGLAAIALRGAWAAELAARTVPLDLRAAAFPAGSVAATVHRHATVVVMRVDDGFDLLVPRSLGEDFALRLAEIAERLG